MIQWKVDESVAELSTKSKDHIEQETAIAWGSRALASYALFRATGDQKWLRDGDDYAHEAIEHASFAGNDCSLVQEVKITMLSSRAGAVT